MSQHEWVETSRKPLPCPCCANLNKRPKQIPVLILHLVKKLSASISRLGSYVGYLAGVCRPRCASVWQSVQQHSRTGPQPGSIFHPRNVGIHARGNRVVNCSSSGHALRRAQTKPKKGVIDKIQPQDERAGARARAERCQSPSSLTAEHAGIVGGISWTFSTG